MSCRSYLGVIPELMVLVKGRGKLIEGYKKDKTIHFIILLKI